MPEIPTREPGSFAQRFADLSKKIEQNVKQAVEALHKKCLDDEKYIPSTEELKTLLVRMDYCHIAYPARKRGENNGRTYLLRVYAFVLEQNVDEESSQALGSTLDTTKKSVSGIL